MLWLIGGSSADQTPVFRVDADLVMVDLVATDRSGAFVADLQASDIELLENGRPQKIEFVRLVRGRAPAAGGASAPSGAPDAARTVPNRSDSPEPADAGTAAEGTAIAIVLDMATIPADAIGRVREAIDGMVDRELPADARILVASVADGITIHQPFTADRAAVRGALHGLPGPSGTPVGFREMLDTADQLCETAATRADPMPAFEQMIALGKAMLFENRRQIATMADGLKALSRSVAAMPGRKHLVLYSAGYPLDPVNHVIELAVAANSACAGTDPAGAPNRLGATGRDQSAGSLRRRIAEELSGGATFDVAGTLQAVVDRANRAQVSFYAIDPRGLATTAPQATQRASARMTRSGQLQRFTALEVTLPQEFLRTVAGDTGGRAFLNTNDLSAGLRRAWADASEYYLIGYRPAVTPRPGTFHRIELRLRRSDLDARYRRGYYAVTPREMATSDIEQALRAPAAFDGTGLEVDASFTARGRLRVVALLPPSAIRFTPSDRGHVAEISVHATLRDEKGSLYGGKALFGRDVSLRLSPEQLKALLASDNVEIPVEVDAPSPAKYRLTVAARESGGWVGARTIDLTLQR
jgi:VWFA-related protein